MEDKKTTESVTKRVTTQPKSRGRSEFIVELLDQMETKLADPKAKATLADYIKLLQLEREFQADAPKEIEVSWVETFEKDSDLSE